jgi:hypothetical protein
MWACRSFWIWGILTFLMVVVQLLGVSEKVWIMVSIFSRRVDRLLLTIVS